MFDKFAVFFVSSYFVGGHHSLVDLVHDVFVGSPVLHPFETLNLMLRPANALFQSLNNRDKDFVKQVKADKGHLKSKNPGSECDSADYTLNFRILT